MLFEGDFGFLLSFKSLANIYGPSHKKSDCSLGTTKMQISRTLSSTKSDQHLCYLLSMKYNSLSCYVPKFNILASRCSSAGWIEPYLVEKIRDGFSPEEFHISFTRIITL